MDSSTNGTFLNGRQLVKGTYVALRDADLLCFAGADPRAEKTIGFRFRAYDAATFGGAGPAPLIAGQENVTHNAEGLASKRARPSGHDASLAVDLHASNQALRSKVTELTAQLTEQAKAATADAATAAAALAALQEELSDVRRAACAAAEDAAQAHAAERAKGEARVQELQAALDAEKARLDAAQSAAAEAEQEAMNARAERDAAQARAREAEAALEAARSKLEEEKDANRLVLRRERETVASLREDVSAREAALAAERAEKEMAQRRAERGATDADAAATALQAERDKRAAAEAAAAKAVEAATIAEAKAARLDEETRGFRESGMLDSALSAKLIEVVRSVHMLSAEVLPLADALQQKRAHGSSADAVPRQHVVHESAGDRPTQQVPLLQGLPATAAAAAAAAAAAPPCAPSDTQELEGEAPMAAAHVDVVAPHGAPQTMLHGSIGMDGPAIETDEDAAPRPRTSAPLPPIQEIAMEEMTPSMQAAIQMADEAEARGGHHASYTEHGTAAY